MTWNPYDVLQIPRSSSADVAKAAYRKLAMEHHPDHGGSEAKFKDVKAAWEAIERGWAEPERTAAPTPPPAAQAKSSFKKQETAGKPAPGYEARGAPPPMPKTTRVGKGTDFAVQLEITAEQAFEGCVVPFVHQGQILTYDVRPGSTSMWGVKQTFVMDDMIGASRRNVVAIFVTLNVSLPSTHSFRPDSELHDEPTGNVDATIQLCALGMFTGGKVTIRDHLNVPVSIQIPPGYNAKEPIIVKNRGYGPKNKRGDLFVTVEPVFKAPKELNSGERQQLERLNEMVNA